MALFVDTATRAHDAFALTAANASSVARVCRLTGGLLPALELATSWLRVLTVSQVADELDRGIELLETTDTPGKARHRSVRATSRGSWECLCGAESRALRALSVFRGGFTRETANEVAGAGLPLLLVLRNTSYLALDASGLFAQHPLLEGQDHRAVHGYRLELLENRALLHYLRDDVAGATAALASLCELDEAGGADLRARLALDGSDTRAPRRLAHAALQSAHAGIAVKDRLNFGGGARLLLAEAMADEPTTARGHLVETLRISHRHRFVPVALDAFVTASLLEPTDELWPLLRLVAESPAATAPTRKRAAVLLGEHRGATRGSVDLGAEGAVLARAEALATR
ncbi:MAG TPA: hypothetical protein VF202_14585 [Trueperaceae bacterium]